MLPSTFTFIDRANCILLIVYWSLSLPIAYCLLRIALCIHGKQILHECKLKIWIYINVSMVFADYYPILTNPDR